MSANTCFPKSKNKVAVALLTFAMIALALSATGCAKLKSRDQLNKGVAAYQNGRYDQAIENFKQAKDLDPTLINARIYLATAYANLYVPGAPSEENIRKGQQAVKEFKEILAVDPTNIRAIDGIGLILYNMAGAPFNRALFDESKSYHLKHIALKPEDPEPYFRVGVIDYTLAYISHVAMRAQWRLAHQGRPLKDDDPMPEDVREAYASQNGPLIDEGINMLRKALELRPDYDDAMAYINLLLRRKADEAAFQSERASLLREADASMEKAKELKQTKKEVPANI
jgi:tetratricopeptide (TPR) repeat protein